MGAGASSLSTSTSTTFPGEGRVGKFSIPPALQRDTLVLSKLFERLLDTNNLMNFAKLMGTEEDKCGSLQLVLASQINKEFQTLRFPDPSIPSSLQLVSFVDTEQYKKLKTSGVLQKMCLRISEFLIRFVALVASLAFSVTIPKGLPMISDSSGKDIYRPARAVQIITPIPLTIWQIVRNITEANWIGGNDAQTSELMLINNEFFMNRNGYIYQNKSKSVILYVDFEYFRYDLNTFSQKTESEARLETEARARRGQDEKLRQFISDNPDYAKFNLTTDRARSNVLKAMQEDELKRRGPYNPFAPFGQPGMQQYQPPLPLAAASAGPIGGKRKSRRGRRNYVGGGGIGGLNAGNVSNPTGSSVVSPTAGFPVETGTTSVVNKSFYKIRFKRITDGTTVGSEYVFTDTPGSIGDAVEKRVFDATLLQGVQQLQTMQPKYEEGRKLNLSLILELIFRQAGKEEQDMIRERISGSQALTLSEITKPEFLRRMLESEFISPAAYRAYLLASMVPIQDASAIESYLCKDTWALTSLNSKPAYASFEALFSYKPDVVVEGDERASSDKMQFVERMVAFKFAEQKDVGSSRDAANFATVQFPDNKDPRNRAKLAGICSTTRSPTLMINNRESVEILMNGYNTLKQLYLQHVKDVYEFLKTVLTVDSEFEQLIQLSSEAAGTKPIIRLNESFVKYSTGSHMALNERILKARTMLGEHYFQVEKIYNETLDKLNNVV